MDNGIISTITTMIGSIGFPIVAYLLMYNQVNKMTEAHKSETDSLREAIENNTLVVQKLLDKIEE